MPGMRFMWPSLPAMPSPGESQANPTIAKALNANYDLLEATCNRCRRISVVPLRGLKRAPSTPIWKLEPALYCEPCTEKQDRRPAPARSHSAADYAEPDPDATKQAQR